MFRGKNMPKEIIIGLQQLSKFYVNNKFSLKTECY